MKAKIDDLGKVSVTVEEDDHNPSQFYYENTIVTDTNLGICCISLRPVPAGIPITDTRFWKCITKLDSSLMLRYRKMINELEAIKSILDSIVKNHTLGTPFSSALGNSEIIGVNQRTISDIVSSFDRRISDLEGKNTFGFNLYIKPKYVIATEEIQININCVSNNDAFDSLKIYFNEELKVDRENVIDFTHVDNISETTKIRVEAIIDGLYYVQTRLVKYYYYPLIICGAETLSDIFTEENIVDYDGTIEGIYNIECSNNDNIYIAFKNDMPCPFEHITVNDVETSFETIEYEGYIVYKSTNTYSFGNYKINIIC